LVPMQRFALNRIACPSLGLEEFFSFAARLGIGKVELRNDLPGGEVLDGMSPSRAAALADRYGVRVVTVNALQKFDLAAGRPARMKELEKLLDLSAEVRCPAVVLCPTNDKKDARDPAARMRETVEALAAYGPLFASRGMLGFVEPLGFGECAVQSILAAGEAIVQSGFACFRTVYDTFHHYLGPDKDQDLPRAAPMMGLSRP
jgi:2-keto-myo-inositol isomerase